MNFARLQRLLFEYLKTRIRTGEISERSLARITGISQPHLHNVLKGTRLLSLEKTDQILRHLRLDVRDLLNADGVEGQDFPGAAEP
jgi:hypothetical protein